MDRTDWFLALITFLLAVIVLDTVTVDTNQVFLDIGTSVSLLVICLLPLYLLAHVVITHHSEPDWLDW